MLPTSVGVESTAKTASQPSFRSPIVHCHLTGTPGLLLLDEDYNSGAIGFDWFSAGCWSRVVVDRLAT